MGGCLIINKFSQLRDTISEKENALRVRLEDAVPDAFEMILNYIYSDRIDPTRKSA